jgi:Amiloride-sensitive sodium channel
MCHVDASRPITNLNTWIEDVTLYDNCNGCLDAIRKIKIPLREMLIECKFRNRLINCSEFFTETIVNHRLCYTFNEMGFYRQYNGNEKNMEDWSIDEGYKPTDAIDNFPYRALEAGPQFGLSMLMIDEYKLDPACMRDEGFTV